MLRVKKNTSSFAWPRPILQTGKLRPRGARELSHHESKAGAGLELSYPAYHVGGSLT